MEEGERVLPAPFQLSEADIRQLGAPRPVRMTTGWRIYQIKPGLSRAWRHPPSKKWPEPGPSLSHYGKHSCIGTVMTVEHTVRFTAARVLLQRPRQGAWDLGAWDDPVWINVWTNVNRRGEPRGVYFCAVAPMDEIPAWEAIEGQDEEARDEEARPACLAAALASPGSGAGGGEASQGRSAREGYAKARSAAVASGSSSIPRAAGRGTSRSRPARGRAQGRAQGSAGGSAGGLSGRRNSGYG